MFGQKKEGEEEHHKGKLISRRKLFKRALVATAAATIVPSTDIPEKAGKGALIIAHKWVLGRRVQLSPEDTADTIIAESAPSVEIGLGNSNAYGTGTRDGKSLVHRISEAASERGVQLGHVSGAVPGSLAQDIPKQYEKLQEKIPPNADQYVDVWATENQLSKFPQALQNMKELGKNPRQPLRWFEYFLNRGKIIDSLEKDLAQGIDAVLEKGNGKIKGVKVRGASPVQKAQAIQQIDPHNPKNDYTVNVAGNSPEELATQMAAADWTYEATRTARDVTRKQRGKRPDVQITVDDPHDDVQSSDYNGQHFGEKAADRIARKTARKIRKNIR